MRSLRYGAALAAGLWLVGMASGAGMIRGGEDAPAPYVASDWVGKKVGFLTGTLFDQTVEKDIPGAIPVFFNTKNDFYEALHAGKVDGVLDTVVSGTKFSQKMPEIRLLRPWVIEIDCGVIFRQGNDALLASFNAFLARIKAEGIYDDMHRRWVDSAEPPPMPDLSTPGANGTLRFATALDTDGISFLHNGLPAGFDVELAYRFARDQDMKLELLTMDWGGLLLAVASGKVDFASNLIMNTPERRERVAFSDVYYASAGVMIVMNPDYRPAPEEAASGLWSGLSNSFHRNLLLESRWMQLAKGLGVTMLIAVSAFALGALLGSAVCWLNLSRNRWANGLGRLYVTLMRGIPMVVLLMVLYYVVFARVDLSPVEVAIIAFALNAGATLGGIFRAAVRTVDAGQVEAARAMGFGRVAAFLAVTLPQARRVAVPLCQSEFVSMFKLTSVVGFIAVVDLTKAGDIIRSRTYDAFFPLLTVAVIYLLATGALIWLFERMGGERKETSW